MSILRESYLYHLWAVLCTVYYDSAVHRCLVRMGAWCNRQIDESRVLRVLCREGVAARAWEESILCRLLTGLINLPAWLLHKLYLALRATFDDSVFSRLAFEMGHETAVAQSWLIMLLWVIPFSHWNNAYSMLGFAALLVLFYAGAMSRRDFRLDVKHIGFYPVVLFGAMFLAVLFSYEPSASFRFLLYHISAALCVLVTVSAVRGTEDLKRLAAGGGVCVLVSSLYGVYQRIQGVEVNESYVDLEVNAGMPGRVESYFDNPNTFAEVLILLLPLVLALILCSKRGISRVTACGVFAVGVLALGMTYSRASWVGMACAMVVLVFLWKPKLIPAFAVLCVVMVPFLPDTIWHPGPDDLQSGGYLHCQPHPLVSGGTGGHPGRLPSPARVWAPPPCRTTSATSTSTTQKRPSFTPTTSTCRYGSRRDCWGFWALWAPCCGTSKRRPARSGTAPPLPPAPSTCAGAAGSVRRHGVRSGGLPVELSPGDVHFLVRVRADHRGDQGLPPGDGGGLMEERNCPMEDPFAFLTLNFLKKSEIFPGSLGTFRYRFQRTGKVNDGTVQAWVYENICFEKAQHIETETFPWTEEGMASLRSWLNERLRERGSELYRVWGGR